jgi:hypothetical protein
MTSSQGGPGKKPQLTVSESLLGMLLLWLWILLQFGCGLQKQINPWKIPQNCPL